MKYEFYRGDPKLMNYQHLLKYDMHDAHPLKKTRFIVSPLKRNGMVRTAVPCATQPAMLTSTVLFLLVHTYMYMYSTVQYSTIHVHVRSVDIARRTKHAFCPDLQAASWGGVLKLRVSGEFGFILDITLNGIPYEIHQYIDQRLDQG
jgi:hypothetical protein